MTSNPLPLFPKEAVPQRERGGEDGAVRQMSKVLECGR
jgi:hypothetical protein